MELFARHTLKKPSGCRVYSRQCRPHPRACPPPPSSMQTLFWTTLAYISSHALLIELPVSSCDSERLSRGSSFSWNVQSTRGWLAFQAARPALREDCLLLAYPNAGEEWCAGGQPGTQRGWKLGSGSAVSEFAAAAGEWHHLGATILGGCCRTTPEYIRQLACQLKSSGSAAVAQKDV